MNWDAIGAIGEIVGATAVVVSLLYLAAQIRTSSRATRASVFQGLHDAFAEFDRLLVSDAELGRLFEAICSGDAALDSADGKRAAELLVQLFNKYELFFILNRERMLAHDVAEAMGVIVGRKVREPGVAAWWKTNQFRYSKEFVEWANQLDVRL